MRAVAFTLIALVPVVAFASTTADQAATSVASLMLQCAIAAMQVYLTSRLPPIEKRLSSVEVQLKTVVSRVDG